MSACASGHCAASSCAGAVSSMDTCSDKRLSVRQRTSRANGATTAYMQRNVWALWLGRLEERSRICILRKLPWLIPLALGVPVPVAVAVVVTMPVDMMPHIGSHDCMARNPGHGLWSPQEVLARARRSVRDSSTTCTAAGETQAAAQRHVCWRTRCGRHYST